MTEEALFTESIQENRALKEAALTLKNTVEEKVVEYDQAVVALQTQNTEKMGAFERNIDDFKQSAEANLKYLHDFYIDLLDEKFDKDTFYPVLISLSSTLETRISLTKWYTANNRENGAGLAGVNLSLLVGGGTRGGNSMHIAVLHNAQTYRPTVPAIGFMSHGYTLGLFLRGGYKYDLKSSNHNTNVVILDSEIEYYSNLTAGPVDYNTAQASAGAFAIASNFHMHNFNIKELGKTEA